MRKPLEYIAYEGRRFVIEWYFDDGGYSQALEYAETLDDFHRRKLLELFKLMGDIGQVHNKLKFRNEGDRLYAFKPKPHRFLCFFFTGRKVIVTNGFYKDQDKLPSNEKKRALQFKEDYETRVRAGIYYAKE